MTVTVTLFPIGDADTCRIDLADGRKILIDYAHMQIPSDRYEKRCDLPSELRSDLAAAGRKDYDVVCFSHLDLDHVKGASEFFWFDHAAAYQGDWRIKIKELWVPAAAVTEVGIDGDARVIRQEARHRLKSGYGIKVFSRPDCLQKLLADWGLTIEDRKDCIVDAGTYVPGFSTGGPERVKFFVHSPFAWPRDDRGYEERNSDSVMFQATYLEGTQEVYALFGADVDADTLAQIVQTTKRHGNQDRLLWDFLKLFHHCSYLSLSNEKGEDETTPVPDVAWLFETQGRDCCIIVSPSRPIPVKGTKEDEDVQPPHRQAANYYRRVVSAKAGEFKVTMETPNQNRPQPLRVEITWRGARLATTLATAIGIATSTPARAG